MPGSITHDVSQHRCGLYRICPATKTQTLILKRNITTTHWRCMCSQVVGIATSYRALRQGARCSGPKHPPHPGQSRLRRRRCPPPQRHQETPSSPGNRRTAPPSDSGLRGCTDAAAWGWTRRISRGNPRSDTACHRRADPPETSGDGGDGEGRRSNCLQRSLGSAIVRSASPIFAPAPAASAPPAPRSWFYCCHWRLPSSGGSTLLLPSGNKHIEREGEAERGLLLQRVLFNSERVSRSPLFRATTTTHTLTHTDAAAAAGETAHLASHWSAAWSSTPITPLLRRKCLL